jgi:hypothetical protein
LDPNSSDAADIADIQRATGGTVRVVPATTPMQKKLEGRMKGLGRRVVFVEDSSGTFNGAASTNDSRTVYVRADADDATAVPTVAHELLHAVAREAPDVVEKVVGTVSGERLAAARAKYRGRLVRSFGENSRVVKNFDKDEKLATEEAVAQIIEDAAEGDADAARMLYETPGLLQRLKQIVRRLLDKMGVARLTAEEKSLMRLFETLEKNAEDGARRSITWANSKGGITTKLQEAYANTPDSEYRRTARDILAEQDVADGVNLDTMFSWPSRLGELAGETRWMREDPVLRGLLTFGNPKGGGPLAFKSLGQDKYIEIAYAEAGLTRPETAIDALRSDPDPQNQFIAAVAITAQEYERTPSIRRVTDKATGEQKEVRADIAKLPPKVPFPAAALQPGDVFFVNDQPVRVLRDEDERRVLVGGSFRGIVVDGLTTIPIDKNSHSREGTRRNVEAVQAMGSEATDVPSGGGSRGAVLDSDVPFSPRDGVRPLRITRNGSVFAKMQDVFDFYNGRGDTVTQRQDGLVVVRHQTGAKTVYAQTENNEWHEYEKTSAPGMPRSMFDRTDDSKGTASAQGSLFGIPADAVAKTPPKLSPAEMRELYPGIRVGETVAKYEKRMGTADTPVMFSPLPATIEVDGVQRPTTNSNGQPIAQDEASVRNFWKWFGGSRVVDGEGRPKVVYHGTDASIDRFDAGSRGRVTNAASARMGFFFTDDTRTAASYANFAATDARIAALVKRAEQAGERGDWDTHDRLVTEYEALEKSFQDSANRANGQNIVPVYLAVNRPLEVDAKGENAEGFDIPAAIRRATATRRDGVIIANLDDAAGLANRPATHFVVMRETQIKSATGNLGTFDPANPDIRFAPKGMARIEQRGAEQAQREIDRGAKKLESERAKAEAQRAAARATITTLRDQLGAAMRREKGLTRVVGILETMRARQEARADEATAENQARAQAMKQMRETQREVEQVKDELVRIIRDALPRTMHAAFITDIQKVRSRSQLPGIVAKIETASLQAEALELDAKMKRLTGVSNTSKLTDPDTLKRVVGDKGNTGKLRKLSGVDGARDAARKAMADFVQAAAGFNAPGTDAAKKREMLGLLELAYQNLSTIVQEQRVADRLLAGGRRQSLVDAVAALAGRLSTLPVRTAIRRLTKTVGEGKMGAFVKLADAETMMLLLDGKLEGGDFYNRIYEPLRAAMNRQFEIVDAMMTRADGHARRAGFKDQADMEVRLFGLAGDANAISYDLPVEIGGTKKIPASQALKLYAMDQETLADTMNGRAWKWDDDGGEYTIDWKQYDALVKAIPAEHRALVDALKADRDTLFPKFAQTVKILTGTEPPKVFGYDVRRVSPRWMRQNKIDTPIQTGPTGHIAASLENVGMGKARVSTKAPLLATNFYGDWKQSVDMQSRVIELATPIRDAKMMIRNGKVADAIAAKIHPGALQRLERMLDDVAGVNQTDPSAGARIWATLGRNVGKSLTQLNVQSWLRNTAGIATLAPEMPAAAFADGVRGMFSTKFADMMQESLFLRRMYGQNVVAMKSVQAYEGTTPDARGPGALGTAGRGVRIAALSSRSAGQNLARAVMQQPGAWQSAMEDMHNAMKAGGSITDGIGVMHWFASLPARIAYAGWKAEAVRRGENADWAMKQMEQSLRRTQGMNDALMLNGLQSQFRGTYMQPFFMFTNDSVRMANMVMRATMSGDRTQQARVAGAIAVSAALGSVITAALGREGLRALLNDDEDEREKARKQAAEVAAWTFARDSLGIIAPGIADRLVEFVQAVMAPRRGVTATDAALGNPVVSMFGGIVGAISQGARGATEMVQGDDGRGNTGGENVTGAMERFATGVLRIYGSPLPSLPSQVRRVTGAGE